MVVSPCGIFINTEFPFLGATPDGSVYDPNELELPYGYLEVRCPYSVRDRTPEEACLASNFYCNLDYTRKLKLKETHQYFVQVQGQMALNLFGKTCFMFGKTRHLLKALTNECSNER